MKEEEIKIRINTNIKKDFQNICEKEGITMSNKINNFIVKEVSLKKIKPLENRVITRKLIRLDYTIHYDKIPNSVGRIYTKNEFLRIRLDDDGLEYTELERLNGKILYGQYGHPDNDCEIHKYNATHSINNIRIDGEWLIGDVTIINDSIIPILDKLIFRPRSTGWEAKNGIIYDLDVIGFDAILINNDNFNELDYGI